MFSRADRFRRARKAEVRPLEILPRGNGLDNSVLRAGQPRCSDDERRQVKRHEQIHGVSLLRFSFWPLFPPARTPFTRHPNESDDREVHQGGKQERAFEKFPGVRPEIPWPEARRWR